MTRKWKNSIVSCHRFYDGEMFSEYGSALKIMSSHSLNIMYSKDYVEYDHIKIFNYYYCKESFLKEGILIKKRVNKNKK